VPSGPITIFVPEAAAFGGAERSVIALSRWLHQRAISHRILLYYDHIGLGRFAAHPVESVVLNPPRNVFGKVCALRRFLKALPNGAPAPLMSGIQAATHAGLANIRGFHTLMHDTPSLIGQGDVRSQRGPRRMVTDAILRRGLNSGGTTIVTSEYLRDEAVRLWHPPVAIARMGGTGAKAFRPRAAHGPLRLLSVSRVEANKRIDWLIDGLAALEQRPTALSAKADWHLDIVGDGSQIGPLTALAARLGLADRVTFHGFVCDDRLEEHYDRADLFLMPAMQGYGIPAAEAIARGVPVLLHRESGISDLLLDTPWAVVMQGGKDQLAAALEQAIGDVLNNRHLDAPPPTIPTEDEWAGQVARLCGWYP
jgi:glycosyltransferase involved in cell wall biosynthesis